MPGDSRDDSIWVYLPTAGGVVVHSTLDGGHLGVRFGTAHIQEVTAAAVGVHAGGACVVVQLRTFSVREGGVMG